MAGSSGRVLREREKCFWGEKLPGTRKRQAVMKMEWVTESCRTGSMSADGQVMARAEGSGPRVTTKRK